MNTPGLTIKEAAALLQIHEKTVRRRIQLGKLPAVKVLGESGPEWRVYVDGVPPESTLDTPPLSTPESSDLAGLIERLHRESTDNAIAAAHWQARYQEAERRATHAEDQVRLLMAPVEPEPEPESTPERKPWWRRLLG